MKRLLGRKTFAGLLAAGAAPVWVRSTAHAADSFTMRFAGSDTSTSILGQTAIRFAVGANGKSKDALKIEVYPDGQLIRQQDLIVALTTGVVDFTITTATFLQSLLPRLQVLDMPFMFKDAAAAYRVLDGRIGDDFAAELDSKGIVVLGWCADGFRQLETTTKAVAVPEDMKGLRVRIQAGGVYSSMFQALGALPVTIDSNESYTALTQHTVDGVEYPLTRFSDGKFYTVCKHVAMTNHVFSVTPILASKRKLETLSPALQRIVRDEGKKVVAFCRTGVAHQAIAQIQMLKGAGVSFSETQYPAFRKAVEPVYAQFQSKIGGDVLDRVSRIAAGGAG